MGSSTNDHSKVETQEWRTPPVLRGARSMTVRGEYRAGSHSEIWSRKGIIRKWFAPHALSCATLLAPRWRRCLGIAYLDPSILDPSILWCLWIADQDPSIRVDPSIRLRWTSTLWWCATNPGNYPSNCHCRMRAGEQLLWWPTPVLQTKQLSIVPTRCAREANPSSPWSVFPHPSQNYLSHWPCVYWWCDALSWFVSILSQWGKMMTRGTSSVREDAFEPASKLMVRHFPHQCEGFCREQLLPSLCRHQRIDEYWWWVRVCEYYSLSIHNNFYCSPPLTSSCSLLDRYFIFLVLWETPYFQFCITQSSFRWGEKNNKILLSVCLKYNMNMIDIY